jgi:hypothetical protein
VGNRQAFVVAIIEQMAIGRFANLVLNFENPKTAYEVELPKPVAATICSHCSADWGACQFQSVASSEWFLIKGLQLSYRCLQ